ncbi:arylamine N-acetyltransferase [Bacillus sp. CLL-7-23]|uniref:Arylamine N-acetyltransferase n=1 Tax=Bacillus changyiensis TaxID=3004103 RepID=A0ABT4WZV2_9BACI|nr:arylamine N-acetyltransferase [Bacillus changyiensis]MDA7025576.1 arylamine N-acetyltransferase [Bacillus changyiensis]
MTVLLDLLYKRIGYDSHHVISFNDLPEFLERVAYQFPFENSSVLKKERIPMTKKSLTEALLNQQRGGLCYDLNAFLYYVLKDLGFSVHMIQGTVYNEKNQLWSLTGTHVAIVLWEENEAFLIDTGFGLNLPLAPVPLSGEVLTSKTGHYRVQKTNIDKGDYLLEIDKGEGWQTGYAFSIEPINEVVLADVRELIYNHPDSPFNQEPLACKLTRNGTIVLKKDYFTKRTSHNLSKQNLKQGEFTRMFNKYFFEDD